MSDTHMTTWIESLENPQAVRPFFGSETDLTHVNLHEVTLVSDGPGIRFRFDVSTVPSPLPRKWPGGSNTTQFVVAAWGVSNLEVWGWQTSLPGYLSVSRSDSVPYLRFHGAGCELKAAFTALRVERITGYVNDEQV